MKIAFGCDHAGFQHKTAMLKFLRSLGHSVKDFGAFSEESVDYPDFASAVGASVQGKKADRGLLVCGTGIGMAIAANKVKGVRAAVVWSAETARLAAEHNAANVLCLSGRMFRIDQIKKMVRIWLATRYGAGRHRRRILKIEKLERRQCR